MGIWDAVENTVESVAEANVLPIGIGANIARMGDDPLGSITNIGGLLSPALGFVTTLPGPSVASPISAARAGRPSSLRRCRP
jgi:hypothetical protein